MVIALFKRSQLAFIFVSMMLCALFAGVFTGVTYAPLDNVQGDAYFDVNSVSWDTNDHPLAAPGTYWFTLDIMVRNLTDVTGLVFQITWDGSLLNLTEAVMGDCLQGTVPLLTFAELNNDVGYIEELLIAHLMPTPVNITYELPGWAATLNFTYVGGAPPPGATYSTDIEIVLQSPVDPDLNTNWRDSYSAYYLFETLGTCSFSYESVIETFTFDVIVDAQTYYVTIESNSTVSGFDFRKDQKEIRFSVSGSEGTGGFCNVIVPLNLMKSEPEWLILIDGTDTPQTSSTSDNETHTFLYFTYTHSTHDIMIRGTWVVPEFPVMAEMLVLIIVVTLAAIMFRKKPRPPLKRNTRN